MNSGDMSQSEQLGSGFNKANGSQLSEGAGGQQGEGLQGSSQQSHQGVGGDTHNDHLSPRDEEIRDINRRAPDETT